MSGTIALFCSRSIDPLRARKYRIAFDPPQDGS